MAEASAMISFFFIVWSLNWLRLGAIRQNSFMV
jgi:hypothetical protein